MFLAINPGRVTGAAAGHGDQRSGVRPAGGLDRRRPARAGAGAGLHGGRRRHRGRDAPVNQLIHTHAAELLGRAGGAAAARPPRARTRRSWSRTSCRSCCRSRRCRRCCRTCSTKACTIRDMRTILEALAEHAPRTQDAAELTAPVRVALGRAIVQQMFPGRAELQVIALDPAARARAAAGAAGRRRRRRHRAGARRHAAARRAGGGRSTRSSSACRPCCSCPRRCARCCRASCAARMPHLQGALACGSAGRACHQGHIVIGGRS